MTNLVLCSPKYLITQSWFPEFFVNRLLGKLENQVDMKAAHKTTCNMKIALQHKLENSSGSWHHRLNKRLIKVLTLEKKLFQKIKPFGTMILLGIAATVAGIMRDYPVTHQ